MKKLNYTVLFLIILSTLTFSISAQTKKRGAQQPEPKPTVQPQAEDVESGGFSSPKVPTKKNERPTGDGSKKLNRSANAPVYFYEFSQPDFLVSKVLIEHDEEGKGKITFKKRDSDEEITDPLALSAASLEHVKDIWRALNFLDSAENYQSADKDYKHLGNLKFSIKKNDRERSAAFNWTDNKDAKALADAYRRIGNQLIWMFDVNVARENQPLETPRIMDRLDSLMRMNEISDAEQMLPFLKELSDDERIPLIARNHAARAIQQIQKQAAKMKKDKQ